MHFVTGGAYNGKAGWVKRHIPNDVLWISAYQGDPLPENLPKTNNQYAVLEGLETWIRQDAACMDAAGIRRKWQGIFRLWRIWEKEEPGRQAVWIGTDITKGIVPVEQEKRVWRDAAGWIFQDAVSVADRVDVIWYGIASKIK
ncbi:bifunctional adenosylcobinamide kinase/adenosylcobinamide-phosphate guanylyltransferase [Bacillus massiliglaciei]|uniref:bifunctional adenosylcobinamide kinase/adenosylcobinamide-phosphate guanylyltransferase n=1 Tax=Bacillus massiliglaciei TaxID=1816693 RepID=UPI000DA5EFA0|nr:bifunctional adenosylcobinamide kinase/adenosylcobinamide-phosphate guanylyltransferase [Bacillus massiliglaciei]